MDFEEIKKNVLGTESDFDIKETIKTGIIFASMTLLLNVAVSKLDQWSDDL